MAIIVDEERKSTNLMGLLGWAVVIVVLIVAAYYIFFAAPELVVISPPAGYQAIAPLSQVTLQPADVLNKIQALTQPSFALPTPQGPAAVGRANPFIAP